MGNDTIFAISSYNLHFKFEEFWAKHTETIKILAIVGANKDLAKEILYFDENDEIILKDVLSKF